MNVTMSETEIKKDPVQEGITDIVKSSMKSSE
jgi:hypothetical protein